MTAKFDTREGWLMKAVALMEPLFLSANYKVPAVRVSCGWPSSGGLGDQKRTLGECWAAAAAADGVAQIFITPRTDKPEDAYGVLPILVHEVVHAVVGHEAKHGPVFKKCALAVGLEGKMTSTTSGPELIAHIKEWMLELGPYPHAMLNPKMRPKKKQSTRMIKCECRRDDCGYVVRLARKWIDEVGLPHCPKHGKMESDYIPDPEAPKPGEDTDGGGSEE